ncbi:hypothetical protein [Sorangium cellulosum]|uniref:hypothetical protein n=1 Tax=Sorangium cellulosum TaxID=56 RepID=UPI001F1B111A|nr:hypothetical protein [Sorangium cellulosum]
MKSSRIPLQAFPGQSAAGLAIATGALMAAAGLDQERQALYLDVVLSSLNEAARRSLEEKMKSDTSFRAISRAATWPRADRRGGEKRKRTPC